MLKTNPEGLEKKELVVYSGRYQISLMVLHQKKEKQINIFVLVQCYPH